MIPLSVSISSHVNAQTSPIRTEKQFAFFFGDAECDRQISFAIVVCHEFLPSFSFCELVITVVPILNTPVMLSVLRLSPLSSF